MAWILGHTTCILTTLIWIAEGVELPKFIDLKKHYPGYAQYGGHYRDHDIIRVTKAHATSVPHYTSALRLSYALNRIGGVHSIGANRQQLEQNNLESFTGAHGVKYIQDPIVFGPYLDLKYKSPVVIKPDGKDRQMIILNLYGRQGIVRLATYKYKTADAHVALWDCDHFHETRDWSLYRHLIAVEFWESQDSSCAESKDDLAILKRPLRHSRKQHRLRHSRRSSPNYADIPSEE